MLQDYSFSLLSLTILQDCFNPSSNASSYVSKSLALKQTTFIGIDIIYTIHPLLNAIISTDTYISCFSLLGIKIRD